MVTRSRKPVRVPSSVSELFGPRDFTVVAEQEILGQRLNLFFGDKLVDFLFELDEDKRFFAVIGPEHLDLPEGHRAYRIPGLPDGDRACIPCLLCGDRAFGIADLRGEPPEVDIFVDYLDVNLVWTTSTTRSTRWQLRMTARKEVDGPSRALMRQSPFGMVVLTA